MSVANEGCQWHAESEEREAWMPSWTMHHGRVDTPVPMQSQSVKCA
ncbi:hypothetical protein [Salinimonas iocasae]|nr:hypothetical protein [Salinimonas iocasae]